VSGGEQQWRHLGLITKDVGVKADIMDEEVHMTLHKNTLLTSTVKILNKDFVSWKPKQLPILFTLGYDFRLIVTTTTGARRRSGRVMAIR
jgi:hypothetical protein